MVESLSFPEVERHVFFLNEEEKELYQKHKAFAKDNTLEEQLKIIYQIIANTESFSSTLMHLLGKILYNLTKYEELEEQLHKYKNDSFLYIWLGMSAFKRGDFQIASSVFEELSEHESKTLRLHSQIGLARIKDRKGYKKEALEDFEKIKESFDIYLSMDKNEKYLDVWLYCIYGELWASRTERNVEDSKSVCLRNLEIAKDYGDRVHIAQLTMLLGILEKYKGSWKTSKDYFESAKSIYRDLGDRRGEVNIISNMADVDRMIGNFEEAQGRLLSVVSLYESWGDKRSVALVHSNLGEIHAQQRQISQAIQEFLYAKKLLDEIEARDDFVDYALAELYVEQKRMNDFNKIIGEIIKDKTKHEIAQNPHVLYFFGKKEILNLNISKAKTHLVQALSIAGKKRMDHLGAKILVDLIQVVLFNFISQPNTTDMRECEKLIDDLKLFTKETQQLTFSNIIEEINVSCKKISKTKNPTEQRKLVLNTQKIIKELTNLIRYNISPKQEKVAILPNQLIILHRSGIPIKKYVKSVKIVDDILLFGGMVRAAKDIISEVFEGDIGKVMKIDYGEDICILAEFGEKDTGMVMITSKDTFHQRRALHETVKDLNRILLPSKYHGEIEQEKEQLIDEIIFKWFGEGYVGEI